MRKIIYLLLWAALWLTACGSPTGNAPATLESAGAAGGETAPTLAPTTVVPTDIVVHDVKADFVATDPGAVQLAAGKPQLVEFFAVW